MLEALESNEGARALLVPHTPSHQAIRHSYIVDAHRRPIVRRRPTGGAPPSPLPLIMASSLLTLLTLVKSNNQPTNQLASGGSGSGSN